MKEEFKEEIEALEALKEYNVKVVKALREVIPELKGGKKEDTEEYLQHIFKGINWETQVINGTIHYINREKEVISKEAVNNIILQINAVIQKRNEVETAKILEDQLLPFLISLSEII